VFVRFVLDHNAIGITFHLSGKRCSSSRNILASGLRRQGLVMLIPLQQCQLVHDRHQGLSACCGIRHVTIPLIFHHNWTFCVFSTNSKCWEMCCPTLQKRASRNVHVNVSEYICCEFLSYCLTRNHRKERKMENLFSASILHPVILIQCYLNNNVWPSQMLWDVEVKGKGEVM
jgi:hypothetical protein